jgi:hypothetical protein
MSSNGGVTEALQQYDGVNMGRAPAAWYRAK